jgi:hypothetical protein
VVNRGVDAAYDIADQTLNGNNVIYNYEWFLSQYNAYQAINTKIADAERTVQTFVGGLPADRGQWSYADSTEYQRLQAIAEGLKFQRSDIVAEYNAKSSMVNRSIFKDNSLPEALPQ